MRRLFCFTIAFLVGLAGFSQTFNLDSSLNVLRFQKDSTLHALIHADSVKTEKDFTEKVKWAKIKAIAVYPLLNGGENSGIVPVSNPTEIPDPKLEYKLLFEITANNPDSVAKEINGGLAEVARVINLHIASGVPLKKITPVIVVHAAALAAITTNKYYKEKFKMDNPNLKLIDDLKNIGSRFIACGQAMAFFGIRKEDLLPLVKISLTAQTVLSSYQLKGYVLYKY